MTVEARSWIDELMADVAWTRRLAGALLGDPGLADDAVHEVWLKTRGTAPAGVADRRGWVRTLLANALRTRRRSEQRRRAREQGAGGSGVAAPEAVTTPEEMLGRLEVHRTLAALVAGLEEPGRNVLLLHYFEGMTSAQIAMATGMPPGTVRWRLKATLDELRGKLDAHYAAEKKDWRRALVPLLPAGGAALDRSGPAPLPARPPERPARPPGSPGGQPSAVRTAALISALLVGAAAVVVLVALPDRKGGRSGGAGGIAAADAPGSPGSRATGARARRPGRPSAGGAAGPRPVVLAGAAIARPCQEEIRALETDVARAREALAYHLPPPAAWEDAKDAGPNLAAQQAIEPVLARWLDDKGAPPGGRSLDCRRDACRMTVREPWPQVRAWVTRDAGAAAQGAFEAHARAIALDGASKRSSPAGGDEAETQVWFRLHALSGAAGKSMPPPFPASLLPSATRGVPTVGEPGALTPECRERQGVLRGEIEKLRRRSVSLLPAAFLFRTEAPNPELAAKLQAPIDRFVRAGQTLPERERPPALQVECRGSVCRVTAAEGAVLRDAVLGPLLKDEAFSAQIRRTSVRTVNGRAPDGLYVTVLPPPSETTSGEDVLRHFLKQLGQDPAAASCGRRHAPAGVLTMRFLLPGPGEVNEDGVPERISFRLGGPLATTPFGSCLTEAIAARTAAFVPPSGVSRYEMSQTVELPKGS
jgi:RNA polymerase sigma factor (sigma-70 family)